MDVTGDRGTGRCHLENSKLVFNRDRRPECGFLFDPASFDPGVRGGDCPSKYSYAVPRVRGPGGVVRFRRRELCLIDVQYLFLFSKTRAGHGPGVERGSGEFGVSVMQFLIPVVITAGFFGSAAGAGLPLVEADGTKAVGTLVFLQNAGWVWVPSLILSAAAAFFGMNNLKSATPDLGNYTSEFSKTALLVVFGLIAAGVGAYLLTILKLNMWVVLPVTIVMALFLMKALSPRQMKGSLDRQFAIFKNKHNWIMTILYVMTFGSFIGYSASFPKLIQDVFGYLPDGTVNPHAPNPMTWAFSGADGGSADPSDWRMVFG